MEITTIAIIGLVIAVIALSFALVSNRKTDSDNTDNNIADETTGIVLSDSSVVSLADIDELILSDALGQEITFKRQNELTNIEYKEITVSGKGKALQHVGQGAMPVAQQFYTRQQLQSLANDTGLFTSSVKVSDLSQYKSGVNKELYSSVKYGKGGVQNHQGFKAINAAEVTGISPVAVAGFVMQGMAIVSGQYYLKQISDGLNKLNKSVDELKEIHESETSSILMNCRERLMQISQMNTCSDIELNEIRNLANKAREILGQYKMRYMAAYKKVQGYWFNGGISQNAINTYNELITKMRYLLQVCVIADRIIDEALLTEFVTRRKININDPTLEDIYRQMDEHYHRGFNANLCEHYNDYFGNLKIKAKRIRDAGIAGALYSTEAKEEMLKPVNKNLYGMRKDVERISLSARQKVEKSDEEKEILMMIDDKTGEVRMFEPA